MKIEKFITGEVLSKGYAAISKMLEGFKPESLAADMMRYRISGKASAVCHDVYYVAIENGEGIARHWMGWGKHSYAIGNWGNFYTNEECRGKGVGGALLNAWHEDLASPEQVAAGANHPALGEMVWNRYYYKQILKTITEAGLIGKKVALCVPKGDVSKVVGQHRCNIEQLLRETDTRIYKIIGSERACGVMPIEWDLAENFANGANDRVSEITGNAGL